MKKILIISLLVLSGCGAYTRSETSYMPSDFNNSAPVQIIIYRLATSALFIYGFDLHLDDVKLGNLPQHGAYVVNTDAGEHKVRLHNSDKIDSSLDFYALSNSVVYIRCAPHPLVVPYSIAFKDLGKMKLEQVMTIKPPE